MNVSFKNFGQEEVNQMEVEMRDMDRLEFDAMGFGKPIRESLEYLMTKSVRSKAAYVDGNLVCIYGATRRSLLSDDCHPWLCATSQVDLPHVRKAFIKRGKEELSWVLGGFCTAWNLVCVENKTTIRWLKWMGFQFTEEKHDVRGCTFVKFEMRA